MRKYSLIIVVLFAFGCAPEDFSDCLFSSGEELTQQIDLPYFSKIVVGRDISLYITPSDLSQIEVSARKNHLENFRWFVTEDEVLHLEASSICSSGFSEAPLVISLQTPQLTEIISGTQFLVGSKSPLTFPSVTLIADQNHNSASLSMGLFDLEFDNQEVFYRSSNILQSSFSGKTETFGILKTGGVGAINASLLEASTVNVFHRGFNNISVLPKETINAEVRSTGDLIAHFTPQVINVQSFFTGEFVLLHP